MGVIKSIRLQYLASFIWLSLYWSPNQYFYKKRKEVTLSYNMFLGHTLDFLIRTLFPNLLKYIMAKSISHETSYYKLCVLWWGSSFKSLFQTHFALILNLMHLTMMQFWPPIWSPLYSELRHNCRLCSKDYYYYADRIC